MGKDFIPLKLNNYNLKTAYNKIKMAVHVLRTAEISESDNIKNFEYLPSFQDVIEIEAGTDGTTESILRLNNNGFCVVSGLITFEDLIKN